jgi:hypothetical protein
VQKSESHCLILDPSETEEWNVTFFFYWWFMRQPPTFGAETTLGMGSWTESNSCDKKLSDVAKMFASSEKEVFSVMQVLLPRRKEQRPECGGAMLESKLWRMTNICRGSERYSEAPQQGGAMYVKEKQKGRRRSEQHRWYGKIVHFMHVIVCVMLDACSARITSLCFNLICHQLCGTYLFQLCRYFWMFLFPSLPLRVF